MVESSSNSEIQKRNRGRLFAPELPTVSSISLIPLERQVYDGLRRSLMRGEIAPGVKISSRSIADMLNISPMPVREALKRLEADNVLQSQAKRGFVVKPLSEAEFREILSIRLKIEGLLVRHAAHQVSKTKIARLRRLERAMVRERDVRRMLDLNYQFHFTVYAAAKQQITLSLVESIWLRLGPAFWKMVESYSTESADEHHRTLIDSLEAKDADAAEIALRADLLNGALSMGFEVSLQEFEPN